MKDYKRASLQPTGRNSSIGSQEDLQVKVIDQELDRIKQKLRQSSTMAGTVTKMKVDRTKAALQNHQQVAIKAKENRDLMELERLNNLMVATTKTNKKMARMQRMKQRDLEEKMEDNLKKLDTAKDRMKSNNADMFHIQERTKERQTMAQNKRA